MNKSISLNQPWPYLFIIQTMLAMILLNTNLGTVCAITAEIPAISDNENDILMDDANGNANWGQLAKAWGKREANYYADLMEDGEMVPALTFFQMPEIMENENSDDQILNEKRSWKKMNVAWGKRLNGGGYISRDPASYGKREPTWNNLKGMWGKRAAAKAGQWHYLKGSWGKRSAQVPELN